MGAVADVLRVVRIGTNGGGAGPYGTLEHQALRWGLLNVSDRTAGGQLRNQVLAVLAQALRTKGVVRY